jgi:hypothetical protein
LDAAKRWLTAALPCRIVCFLDAGENVEAVGEAAKAILRA